MIKKVSVRISMWLIGFNGMSTHLGLFYAKRFENCRQCTFVFTFFRVVVSQEFFFSQLRGFKYSYLIQTICTQLYGFKYSYLIQIICTQLYRFKYCYLNEIIFIHWYGFLVFLSNSKFCTQLYGFKYFYPIQIISTQLYRFKYFYLTLKWF